MSLDDATLIAYHCGALEPGPALEVEHALRLDPLLAVRARALEQRLIEPPPTADRFRIPPPGLGTSGFGLQGTAGLVMSSDDTLRPGDRFRVGLPAVVAADHRVVVLYRSDNWQVVFPTRREEEVTLEVLPTDDEGRRVLDLSARSERGRQRWAVALPPIGMAIDWHAEETQRWAGLQEAIATGRVPVASVEVHVA